MGSETVLNVIDRQEWLEPLGDQLQQGVHQAFESAGEAGQAVKNALHGTWLGHPLHPVLTDIPVGAWTVALVCDAMEDITGRPEFGKGADVAVAVGLAGALGAAVTGIADWSDTDGKARKTGLVHGLLNVGGAALYGASMVFRKQNKRNLGRGFGLLGYVLAAGAAYLGGELVFSQQVGVNHAASGPPPPEDFVPVLAEGELAEGELKRVSAGGVPVLLVKQGERICAIADTCSHAGGPLSEGTLENGIVQCPWHGSRFDICSGQVVDGPATHPQPRFVQRVRDGQIELKGQA